MDAFENVCSLDNQGYLIIDEMGSSIAKSSHFYARTENIYTDEMGDLKLRVEGVEECRKQYLPFWRIYRLFPSDSPSCLK